MKLSLHRLQSAPHTLVALFLFATSGLYSQVPQGFSYQALIKDASGNPVVSTSLQVRLSIQADTSASPVVLWEELHNPVKSNSYGLINLVLGQGTRQSGTAATFADVDWSNAQRFMRIQLYYQGAWKHMGYSRIWTVPYSMASGNINNLSKLAIKGTTTNMKEALFAVKNQVGDTVFAVYNEGIRAWVDNGAKGVKGGFAIGGLGTSKAPSQPLMVISPDSARIYVDETAVKGVKGGFAIGGFDNAKGTTSEFMFLSPDNYLIGHSSGKLITTGLYNSTLGFHSGVSLTSAQNNVFMGYQSGYSTSSGSNNILIGTSAGYGNTLGHENIILGRQAGYSNSSGYANIILGDLAGYNNTTGYWNVFLGRQAGYSNTTGHANIAIGDFAGHANTTGIDNVMVGDYAGGFNTLGSNNVFLGASAGNKNTSGSYNSFLGFNSGLNNLTGQYNTYLGYKAGYSGVSASGSNNIFMGVEAGYSNTVGFDNVAIGNQAGWSNLDGTYNILIGSNAGNKNVTGDYNSMIGYKAGENTTANWNTMLGYQAGNMNTSGGSQVMIGYTAGQGNTGSYNTMVGSVAGSLSGAGSFNTYIGLAAGNEATGSNNVFIGKWAGWKETGSSKLVIETSYSDVNNFSNALIFGDFIDRSLRFNGMTTSTASRSGMWAGAFLNLGNSTSYYGMKVQAGTNDATGTNYMIDFYDGDGGWEGSVTLANGTLAIYNVSDARKKQDVRSTGINALGMLKNLEVVDFSYTKSPVARHTGYIAQDAFNVFPEMVIYNERDDTYATSQSQLIPVLHKAILEQQAMIDAQAAKIAELEAIVKQLIAK